MSQLNPFDANIVSCDIVGHGLTSTPEQISNVCSVNELVRDSIHEHAPEHAIWASGGDGGHIAFTDAVPTASVLQLADRLVRWSSDSGVGLRVTIHRGPVVCFAGADGRNQLVGDGINLCGSLLNFGTPQAIVVTATFRQHVVQEQCPDISFYHATTVYLKHFAAHSLSILTIGQSSIPPLLTMEISDHKRLEEALAGRRLWAFIYHAKRLLQVNSTLDSLAKRRLRSLDPHEILFKDRAHPLFTFMKVDALREVIEACQLIEREDGDVICRRGDSGDAMFVVLRGEVGVILESTGQLHEGSRNIRLSEGEVVGELALALDRPRTATLQAIGSTALLSISRNTYHQLLASDRATHSVKTAFDTLLTSRIVEHIYRKTDYLRGAVPESSDDPRPWERLLEGTQLLRFDEQEAEGISPRTRTDLSRPGLYILAAGQLVDSIRKSQRKVISDRSFDILQARLHGELASVHREYALDRQEPRPVTVLWIPEQTLRMFAEGPAFYSLTKLVAIRLGQQLAFDAYVAYAMGDHERGEAWCTWLERAGLSVYRGEHDASDFDLNETATAALADARVVVSLLSDAAHTQAIASCRQQHFPGGPPDVLQVVFEEALDHRVPEGEAPIAAGSYGSIQERRAIKRIIDLIHERQLLSPFDTRYWENTPVKITTPRNAPEEETRGMQSTFISYCAPDAGFAEELNEALSSAGVKTFFLPHQTGNRRLHDALRASIGPYDRILLLCSAHSLRQEEVLEEIQQTLIRESQNHGANYLIPIALDGSVYDDTGWAPNPGIAIEVRERVVANFSDATSTSDAAQRFDSALAELLAALLGPGVASGALPDSELLQRAVLTLLRYVAVADGTICERELRMARQLIEEKFPHSAVGYPDQVLLGLRTNRAAVVNALTTIAKHDQPAKEWAYAAVMRMASEDGRIAIKEKRRIEEIELALFR